MSFDPAISEGESHGALLIHDKLDVLSGNQKSEESKTKVRQFEHGFLLTPSTGPIRPLSPDTLSTFSLEEYEQIFTRPPAHLDSSRDGLPSQAWRARINASWIRNKGLAYMLAAQLFGSLMNVTTRLLEIEGNKGKGLHPFQILFPRMFITVLLASAYMHFRKTPYFPFGMKEVRWLLIARGFFGFFGVSGMYWSLLYLPLADATVITFLAPSLACFACSILLKEPFTRVERLAALVSLTGVVLIARPTTLFGSSTSSSEAVPSSGNSDAAPASPDASNYDNVTPAQRLFAVGIALVGVMGAAIVFTVIRWIGKRAHPLVSVNYFAVWCSLISLVAQFALPGVGFLVPADLRDWSLLLFLGCCGFIMQFLQALALAYEKSSRATNMIYLQMLFALGFDKLIFGHIPGLMSVFGSSLILGAAIVVAMQQSSVPKGTQSNTDEESRRGLIDGMEDQQMTEDQVRPQAQELQLMTLRRT